MKLLLVLRGNDSSRWQLAASCQGNGSSCWQTCSKSPSNTVSCCTNRGTEARSCLPRCALPPGQISWPPKFCSAGIKQQHSINSTVAKVDLAGKALQDLEFLQHLILGKLRHFDSQFASLGLHQAIVMERKLLLSQK